MNEDRSKGVLMTASLPSGETIATWERDASGKLVDGSVSNAMTATERRHADVLLVRKLVDTTNISAKDAAQVFAALDRINDALCGRRA